MIKTTSIIIYTFVLLMTAVLFFFCLANNAEDRKREKSFRMMILFSFMSALMGLLSSLFNEKTDYSRITVLAQVLNYAFMVFYWMAFWRYQKNHYPRYSCEMVVDWIILVYMAIYIVFAFANLFLPVFFRFSESGIIEYRKDNFIFTYLTLWYVFYIVYAFTRKCELKVKLTLISYVVTPGILNLVYFLIPKYNYITELYYPLNSMCFMISLYLIYFNLHIETSKKLAKQKEELTNARINLMVSQIQPHFIYNALTAIIDLIDKDKEEAKESIVNFSDYLRLNLDSLKEVKLIPFEKEMEHCETYLHFEKMRFDDIQVEYHLTETAFRIPALSVQPLIENAVKHGLSKTGHGGLLRIGTEKEEKNIIITITDNGVGFDEHDISERTHVGIDNVRKRIQDMCHGELEISSVKGEGTTVRIILPVSEEKA